jgi:hypothetical protein
MSASQSDDDVHQTDDERDARPRAETPADLEFINRLVLNTKPTDRLGVGTRVATAQAHPSASDALTQSCAQHEQPSSPRRTGWPALMGAGAILWGIFDLILFATAWPALLSGGVDASGVVIVGVIGGIGVWGVASGVGMLRRQPWALRSIRLWASFATVLALLQALSIVTCAAIMWNIIESGFRDPITLKFTPRIAILILCIFLLRAAVPILVLAWSRRAAVVAEAATWRSKQRLNQGHNTASPFRARPDPELAPRSAAISTAIIAAPGPSEAMGTSA